MASAEFDDDSEDKKPTVQVGDPFTEKLLLEACLELMKEEAIIAIQDMGAAGLTSSSIEMASKGNVGLEIDLTKVPMRAQNMTAYELMLSESHDFLKALTHRLSYFVLAWELLLSQFRVRHYLLKPSQLMMMLIQQHPYPELQ